jgi:predicted secreted protein
VKILLSWSSGKDSAWALHVLQQRHPGAVAGLLTTINEAVQRVAMHAVRRDVLDAQSVGRWTARPGGPDSRPVLERRVRIADAESASIR